MLQVNLDRALELTNTLLFDGGDAPLNENEIALLKGTWQKATYKQMAVDLGGMDSDYLRTCIGSRLWRRLTSAFDAKEVNKANYAEIVKKRLAQISEQKGTAKPKYIFNTNDGFRILIGNPPCIKSFVGREPEIAMVMAAIKGNQCISMTGAPGIGKSTLAAKIVNICTQKQKQFGFVSCLWKSLSYGPSLSTLLGELLSLFEGEDQSNRTTQELMGKLLSHLKKHKILIVLDSVEALTKEGNRMNPWGRNPEYRSFFNRIIEEQHSSCFILCSQEPIREVKYMENSGLASRAFVIEGLGKDANELLQKTGLKHENLWKQLIGDYQGNPYSLLSVARRVMDFFDGDLPAFLDLKTTCVEDQYVQAILDQISRLTELEQAVLDTFIQSGHENTTFATLRTLFPNESITNLMTAVDRLDERSLIDKTDNKPFSIKISRVVKKVVSLRAELGSNITSPTTPVSA